MERLSRSNPNKLKTITISSNSIKPSKTSLAVNGKFDSREFYGVNVDSIIVTHAIDEVKPVKSSSCACCGAASQSSTTASSNVVSSALEVTNLDDESTTCSPADFEGDMHGRTKSNCSSSCSVM